MKIYSYLYILLSIFVLPAPAQNPPPEVRIELGKTELAEGQPFELKLVVKHQTERPEASFPRLPGLEKGSVTLVRTMLREKDGPVLLQTVVQQYFPGREGLIEIPGFSLTVNGARIPVEGFTLYVRGSGADSLKTGAVVQEDVGLPDEIARGDVFLTLKSSRKQVFLREGFGVYLSLFVARDVPLAMDFYDVDNQIQQILKKIKPDGCWEENTWIAEIKPREVLVGRRRFTEYRLYQSVFFPLILKPVHFPAVGLKMKTGQAGNPASEEEGFRTFYSRPESVAVKPLPPHPRRDVVPVGDYTLQEQLSKSRVAAGESFHYRFTVSGQGNISGIPAPSLPVATAFDFYPPEVASQVSRSLAAVTGEKTFDYTLVGRQRGLFPLQGYFQWIYFNSTRARYDTLKALANVEIVGEELAAGTAGEKDETSLYANLEHLNVTDSFLNYRYVFRIIMNVVVILMLLTVLWIFRH